MSETDITAIFRGRGAFRKIHLSACESILGPNAIELGILGLQRILPIILSQSNNIKELVLTYKGIPSWAKTLDSKCPICPIYHARRIMAFSRVPDGIPEVEKHLGVPATLQSDENGPSRTGPNTWKWVADEGKSLTWRKCITKGQNLFYALNLSYSINTTTNWIWATRPG